MDKKATTHSNFDPQINFGDSDIYPLPDDTSEEASKKDNCPIDIGIPGNQLKQEGKMPVGGIVGIILAVFSVVAAYGWITGYWGTVETIATVVAVAIGSIAAFLMADKFSSIFLITEVIGAVLLWIGAAIADLVLEGFMISWIFTDIILGLFITIPLCVFPALIGAAIVTIIKKLL